MASLNDDANNPLHRCLVVIVGAGPSGLAVAACLQRNGVPSLILERSSCLASLWRDRTYDRLKLHLPKHLCHLPFLDFPRHFPTYPTKDQFVEYVESYARHFSIGPRFGQTVVRAEFDPAVGLWRVQSQDRLYVSSFLVVASGENVEPVMPDITGFETFSGPIIHTCAYKSGLEFRNRRVLVVGCGNSGMEVSLDLCRYNAIPHMVVRNSVHILPRDILGISTFALAMALLKWLPLRLVDKLLLVLATFTLGDTEAFGLPRPKTGPIGLKNATGKTPVLDVGAFSHIKSGKIKVMKGVREITKRGAKFMDGQEKEFDSIILATGYKSNVPTWLKGSDFFTEDGKPKASFGDGWRGKNGLYVVGFTRQGILGTSSDALKIAADIAHKLRIIKSSSQN
ncbi:probable indole-3-pyruvate monooxygenase YUCCA4 [Salvia miltiorrhiza]|uniref:probable indole-3-pyruvate monooxygenase YUCCA4 n=1 Tax=Salvia miltiorrhiza TaxID=226208 RepID=UPI0025AC0F07|nr:probable indole-3-pyruvate monooxygenase YUCCA4 [Salvia miltiorrhiza]